MNEPRPFALEVNSGAEQGPPRFTPAQSGLRPAAIWADQPGHMSPEPMPTRTRLAAFAVALAATAIGFVPPADSPPSGPDDVTVTRSG